MKHDFIQEGTIGLFKAISSVSSQNFLAEEFIPYATTSIKYSMTDFYRKVIGKSIKDKFEYTIDGV
jgi:DNA-directed RNA polymerase specialized sigma subunit